jgi:hypothetical protein
MVLDEGMRAALRGAERAPEMKWAKKCRSRSKAEQEELSALLAQLVEPAAHCAALAAEVVEGDPVSSLAHLITARAAIGEAISRALRSGQRRRK